MDFRKAAINDIDDLARIRSIFLKEANDLSSEEERVKMETANRVYFKTAVADGSFIAWLAVDGEKIVATSGLIFYNVPPSLKCPDGKVAYIMNMFTFPGYRKRGIGMELLKRTVEEAKGRGYKKITLNATNAGRPLYERYGFCDETGDMVLYIK
ncbi:MAG: GNAT family N-acetyltransferase [Oscillospiraceae bacterium]|nr:GNAT family N-acetyltransferase [Oscillospiraceae bacterium]